MKINDVTGLALSMLDDWRGKVINPNWHRAGSSFTWPRKSAFFNDPITVADVLYMIRTYQFSCQIVEYDSATEQDMITGIVQMYYSFDQKSSEIEAASLAYYSTRPAFTRLSIQTKNEMATGFVTNNLTVDMSTNENELSEEEQPIEEDELGNPSENDESRNEAYSQTDRDSANTVSIVTDASTDPATWMRIDYAPQEATDVIHQECHMHLSGLPQTRFVVNGLPNPKQFLELVMASFYPSLYKAHRLDPKQKYRVLSNLAPFNSINRICVQRIDRDIYDHIAHFTIPFRK